MSYIFDGQNKLIILTAGTTTLSVPDLWSRWIDWVGTADNSKYYPAFTSLGGEIIDAAAGTFIPPYLFLLNGWKIRPQEANHTLNVAGGTLVVAGGGDPFANTVGSFIIRINYSQPVQAIAVSTTGGNSGPTVTDIWEYGNRTLTTTALTPTKEEIAEQVRTELIPELNHLMTLNNSTLTISESTMIREMYELFGLDATKPLIVTGSSRNAGSIVQQIVSVSSQTTVTRV